MDTDLLLELHKAKFPLKIWDDSGGIETFHIPTTEQLIEIVKPEWLGMKGKKFMATKGGDAALGLTKDSTLAKLWLLTNKK